MKKLILATIAFMLLVPSLSFAASTIRFVPSSGSYQAGQTFSVQIMVDPQGSSIYTVKAQIKYSADTLEIQSFTFAPSWMPISQSGYNLIDNTNGVLIKTAGYPGGLSSGQSLGAIIFKVKKAGSASLTFGGDSMGLDSSNTNSLLSTLPQAMFSFTIPVREVVSPAIEPSIISSPEPTTSAGKSAPVLVQDNVAIETDASNQSNSPIAEAPLNPLGLAMVSVFAPFSPIMLLIVAFILLVSIFFLREDIRNKKIEISKR